MAVDVPVLELDASAIRRLCDEAHLHLTCFRWIRLDTPPRADIPADHHSCGRLVHEHPRKATLAAVDTPVINMAAHVQLEDRLRDIRVEQVVVEWLELTEVLCEHRERALDRHVHDDLMPDGCRSCLCGHVTSSSGCSTAA